MAEANQILDFPASPSEGTVYTSAVDGRTWEFKSGAWRLIGSTSVMDALRLERYDLAIKDSTDGSGDLSEAQVFKVVNDTNTVKTISFTGAPAGRAMTVIVEVIGNAGAVNVDGAIAVAKDLDTSLATTQTVFVFFYNGQAFKLMSVTRMA